MTPESSSGGGSALTAIGFDADDTLWDHERYFQLTQARFAELLRDYADPHHLADHLLAAERRNILHYGFGVKGFMLSMIETALIISNNTIGIEAIEKIIGYGTALLPRPIELLEGVEEVLTALKDRYRLVVATKGDLLAQERKLRN